MVKIFENMKKKKKKKKKRKESSDKGVLFVFT